MKTTLKPGTELLGWEGIDARMRVVKLTAPLQLLVPALILPSLSKSTRGFTFYSGRLGIGLGLLVLVSSLAMGVLLVQPTGPWGAILSFWFIGTAGLAMVSASVRPIALVKPICVNCRLLPVIREHEAIHLSGVSSEKAVWASMKERYSVQSLALVGDPSICSFCPIPKRLSEH
jgi:hypothetical protein